MAAPCLYRRLDAGSFVRYDPNADSFSVVAATDAIHLFSATSRSVRLSLSPGERHRRLVLLAMLEFQARAHAAGAPEASRPYLDALAHLAEDPDALKRLRLSWTGQQTRRGTVKAVGQGTDAGRVLYGQKALAALRAQESRGGLSGAEHRDRAAKSGEAARSILNKVHKGGISHQDLKELATHLPNLPVERLRNARIILGAGFGGARRRQGMVDALMNHVRAEVDRAAAEEKKAKLRSPLDRKKHPPLDTVIAAVMAHGGIDPKSHALLGHFSNVSNALENGVPLSVFRKGGRGLDQLAQELNTNGLIKVPENADPGEYLIDQIRGRAHTLAADISQQYEEALNEHYRLLQSEHDAPDRPAVEEALRLGEEAGRAEAAADPLGHSGADAGEAGRGRGDADDTGTESVDDSFDFGANAAPEEPAHQLDDAAFAAKVQAAADAHTHEFGDNKVYIGDVFDAMYAEDPSLTRDEFNAKLQRANAAGHLTLSRADLVQLMDPDAVRRSETETAPGTGAKAHFILAAEKKRQQRTPADANARREEETGLHGPDADAYTVRTQPHRATRRDYIERGEGYDPDNPVQAETAGARHRAGVEAALKAGKPVPPEVLKDYPDLGAKAKAEPAASEPEPTHATVAEAGTSDADPVTQPTAPAAEAVEQVEEKGGNPRQVAEAADKASTDYEFARSSAVPNAGEDLKGSARHKANAWRGLAEAEKDGTAAELVTRDNLLKAEPHTLMATIEPSTSLSHLAAYLTLNAFPAAPGDYPAAYDKYRDREGNRTLPRTSPEELRKQYYEAYQKVKDEAEKAAVEETDPKAVAERIKKLSNDLIAKFRGIPETATGYERSSGYSAKDPYNPVANALVGLNKATQTGYGAGKTSVMGRTLDFAKRVKEKYGDLTPEVLNKVHDHVQDVIEGDSFNKTFGTMKDGKKRFSPVDAYVKHTTRKGGRVIDAATVKTGTDFVMKNLGMRGLQWGNSVTDDERQHHLARTADAFADLADVTGLPDTSMSLKNTLGLAIGARGKGNAAAHYEPNTKVINLTRKNGAGTLAHEWAHALDHHVTGGGSVVRNGKQDADYLSADPREHGDDPIKKAMADLRKALASSGFDKRLPGVVRSMQKQGLIPTQTLNVPSGEYWSSPHEKFARAFERHVQHKLGVEGRENTYLSGIGDGEEFHQLWPTREESAHMAPAFDALFAAIREKHFPGEKPAAPTAAPSTPSESDRS